MVWHIILVGLLLGWGIAIPIGPMNLEIIRRNLTWGTAFGLVFGAGVCTADFTYLTLLSLGAITFLTHPLLLKIVGIVGAGILAWFGYRALRLPLKEASLNNAARPSLWGQALAGYSLTLLSPFTIIFWSSISSQLALLISQAPHASIYAGIGVMVGVISWEVSLNIFLHYTRNRLSPKIILILNRVGGLIVIGFAIWGFLHAILY